MKLKINILFAIVIALSGVMFSCQSLTKATDTNTNANAKTAGSTRVTENNTSNAASNPGKAISSALEKITPEQEYYIGRAVGANILASYKIWNGSAALTAYVNRICNAIAINSPRPNIYNGYHAVILDSNEINAFATSGGHIFITRGLINAAKSEDALAGVIAHELAHIQLQHSIKAIKTNRITNALMVTGTSAAAAVMGLASRITNYNLNELTDIFKESVGEIVTTMVNNGYSKSQEFDADNTAMRLMASAGYNPSGLIDMLNELSKVKSGSGGFGKTHPTPAQRISNAQKSVAKYSVADTRSYRRARFSAVK